MEHKNRHTTNWQTELQPDEIASRKEDGEELKVVLLAGLQRLAREAGLEWSNCDIRTPGDTMVQAIYTVKFDDGTQWVGTADCNPRNTNGKYLTYPTAVAESRAEARCLRKALGIRMLSSEEIGLREGFGKLEASPDAKEDSQLIVAIDKLCTSRGIDPVRVLEAVIDNVELASSIFELTELTVQEAQKAIAWLNEQKPKKPNAQTEKDKRDARKKELLAKQEELTDESNV